MTHAPLHFTHTHRPTVTSSILGLLFDKGIGEELLFYLVLGGYLLCRSVQFLMFSDRFWRVLCMCQPDTLFGIFSLFLHAYPYTVRHVLSTVHLHSCFSYQLLSGGCPSSGSPASLSVLCLYFWDMH